MAQQKVKIKIPKDYNPQEREALSIEIIDQIIERTQSGKDKKGNAFAGYSKGYTDSLDFKLGGKSKKVNLELSGEMLNSMTLLTHSSGSITIGYTKDDTFNNGKAEGNIKGTYGQKKPIKGKARDFLGISNSELDEIIEKYPTSKGKSSNSDLLQTLLASEAIGDLTDSFLNVEALDNELQ
jgi:hypothetical protein